MPRHVHDRGGLPAPIPGDTCAHDVPRDMRGDRGDDAVRVDLDAFEQRYLEDADPWGFTSSSYERRKYTITVASLPAVRYRRCFEPGCSIGVLTERLADVADLVVAQDASPAAVARARDRMAGSAGVDVSVGAIPEAWPDGRFDLIVLSEIGYYWDEHDLAGIVDRTFASLEPGGHVVAVHWLGSSDDHLLSGDEVHRIIEVGLGVPIVHHRDVEFVLDVFEPAGLDVSLHPGAAA